MQHKNQNPQEQFCLEQPIDISYFHIQLKQQRIARRSVVDYILTFQPRESYNVATDNAHFSPYHSKRLTVYNLDLKS